jgi:hypothetical protein
MTQGTDEGLWPDEAEDWHITFRLSDARAAGLTAASSISTERSQLDAPDHEACFPKDRYEASEVARFLRNTADYVCEGPVIQDGDTMDGLGGNR